MAPPPNACAIPTPATPDDRAAADAAWAPPAPAPRSLDDAPRVDVGLVALDIDGTLLRPDKRLSRRVVEAIHRTRRRGVKVLLATARPPRGTRPIHAALQLDTPTINYNGALVDDVLRGRFVQHRPLHPPLVGRVAALARRLFPRIRVDAEVLDRWYTDAPPAVGEERSPQRTPRSQGEAGTVAARSDDDAAASRWASACAAASAVSSRSARQWRPDVVCPVEAFTSAPTTKLMFSGEPGEVAQLHAALRCRFGPQIGLVYGEPRLLLAVAAGVDKAPALAAVAAAYGVERQRVLAIGDAGNDAGMLRWAGVGVALANATATARAAASTIAPGNGDDGVAIALERLVLGMGAGRGR